MPAVGHRRERKQIGFRVIKLAEQRIKVSPHESYMLDASTQSRVISQTIDRQISDIMVGPRSDIGLGYERKICCTAGVRSKDRVRIVEDPRQHIGKQHVTAGVSRD